MVSFSKRMTLPPGGRLLIDVMHQFGLAAGRAPARRLIAQGAVFVDERRVTNTDYTFTELGTVRIRVGKTQAIEVELVHWGREPILELIRSAFRSARSAMDHAEGVLTFGEIDRLGVALNNLDEILGWEFHSKDMDEALAEEAADGETDSTNDDGSP